MYHLDPEDVRLFSGSANPELAKAIADQLGIPLSETHISKFSNDNLYIQLGVSVRARTVFIVQSLTSPASDHLLELLMMLDIARGAGAKEIHAIIPYFSFSRSDKKDAPRISITGKLVADLLATAGATHVMTMMLHSPQVHGFFSVPTDPLTAKFIFQRYYKQSNLENTIVVSPDVGNAKAATRFASGLNLEVATGNKERISDSQVRITGLVGKAVAGFKRAIIYDDEIATGGSMVEMSHVLVANGVEEISIACAHGVFTASSGKKYALDRLAEIPQVKEIVTTDTVKIPKEKRRPKLKVLTVADTFAEAMYANQTRKSLNKLFAYGDI